MKNAIVPEHVERRIYLIRGQKVMLDSDLAAIYSVSVKRLNEQVRRNYDRFPSDFMLRLTSVEAKAMRSQNATASKRNVRYLPYAFTEHGAIMLASVLNSPMAVQASIQVVRAFVRLRSMISENQALARRFDRLRRDCKAEFENVWDAIEKLQEPSEKPRPPIGFRRDRPLAKI